MLYLREHIWNMFARKTMVFTMVLALPQEQDCDVVGEPQVLTVKR